MKKLLFGLVLTLAVSSVQAQVIWFNNMQVAKALAIEKDQLILMDFWASWCGPCKTMDKEMWSKEELKELSERFVPFKVDVDFNRELAMQYNASSIPKVVIITVSGEVVWEQTGYSSASPYKKILAQLPKNLNGLNKKLLQYEEDENYYEIGLAYQEAGRDLKNDIGSELLRLSSSYFKKAEKKADDEHVVAMASMHRLLNEVYDGKHKKAMKKVAKVEIGDNAELNDFKNFITAFCYKCEGDEKNYLEAKKSVKDESYQSLLTNEDNQ
ncbi:thioredoxin [Fulvivirga sp. RKSG066]|uniref:thioredoxin family protein n=1 Tax=Fulvivirga aurantia TaxID=2529383 RepID=UPI0012BBED49|nr:thioredoxin family protein [Fulvivirga aurantia]MTI22490.1 thioredoxin [Fulvivirga aurantia]